MSGKKGSFDRSKRKVDVKKSKPKQKNATKTYKKEEQRPILKKIKHYKILQEIGSGGMGTVYLAKQEKPIRRKVAIKVIKPGMDSKDIIARFESERQALAMMNHPNIAQVYEAGETEKGYPYFVMEYVAGLPITDYCDKHKLSIKERIGLFIDVCHAVQHAHFKGIVHRDLKPSNILVFYSEEKHIPKIIDFGIAKALFGYDLTEKTLHTHCGSAIGTPIYMSPEQAEVSAQDIDLRTDIYSLGVMLYELLVGVTPFEEQELQKMGFMEILRIIREESPEKPSTRLKSMGETSTEIVKKRGGNEAAIKKLLHGDLDWIVMKALEKDRKRRYNSPLEFAQDLDRYLNNMPVTARPPSLVYKVFKFIRRNKTRVVIYSSAAMILLTLIIAIVLFTKSHHYKKVLDFHNIEVSPYKLSGDFYKNSIVDIETHVSNIDIKNMEVYSEINFSSRNDKEKRVFPDWIKDYKIIPGGLPEHLSFSFRLDTSRTRNIHESICFDDKLSTPGWLDIKFNIYEYCEDCKNILFYKSQLNSYHFTRSLVNLQFDDKISNWSHQVKRVEIDKFNDFFKKLNVSINHANRWIEKLEQFHLIIIDREGFINITDRQIDDLIDYVHKGGNVLIMHYSNIFKGKRKYDRLLKPFGLLSINRYGNVTKGYPLLIKKQLIRNHKFTENVHSLYLLPSPGLRKLNDKPVFLAVNPEDDNVGVMGLNDEKGVLIIISAFPDLLLQSPNDVFFKNLLRSLE